MMICMSRESFQDMYGSPESDDFVICEKAKGRSSYTTKHFIEIKISRLIQYL